MSEWSLDDSIQRERDLVEAIKRGTRRHTRAILRALFLTLLFPYLAFMVAWLGGNYARAYVNDNFQSSFMSLSTSISSFVVLFAATYYVWRWSEKRFGGLALTRRLMGIAQHVLQVEKAIETVKRKPQTESADFVEIEELTQAAWQQYLQIMREAGFPVEGE
jgi:hypothetical protein